MSRASARCHLYLFQKQDNFACGRHPSSHSYRGHRTSSSWWYSGKQQQPLQLEGSICLYAPRISCILLFGISAATYPIDQLPASFRRPVRCHSGSHWLRNDSGECDTSRYLQLPNYSYRPNGRLPIRQCDDDCY
jgi:hypothetical protein